MDPVLLVLSTVGSLCRPMIAWFGSLLLTVLSYLPVLTIAITEVGTAYLIP